MHIEMERHGKCLLSSLLLLCLIACSKEETGDGLFPTVVEPVAVGVYEEDNRWIYTQMRHHYLWSEDMPDSSSCDYLSDPVTFFKGLLSTKDRFSYCEHNPNYTPPDTRSVSDILNQEDVLCDSVYRFPGHRIGYLCYRRFGEATSLVEPMRRFYREKITDLILDLRYNAGGLVSTCQYLCTSIAPSSAYGQLLEYLHYNRQVTSERIAAGKDSVHRYRFLHPTNDEPTLGTRLYGLQLSRLFVLVSGHTASASESTIVCLKPYMDVTTIGERTVGKGVGMETLRNSRCKYQLVPITFRYFNASDESVPDSGLEPDVFVGGAYTTSHTALGQLTEPLLAKAVSMIVD